VEDKVVIDKNEKRRAYIKECLKKRRADAEFGKKENFLIFLNFILFF